MDQTAYDSEQKAPGARSAPAACAAYDGDTRCIGAARRFATAYLTRVHADHGVPVSARALSMTQLVVSELVTNACRYAPGPCRLDLRVVDGSVEITVWDGDPTLPTPRGPDPARIGQHGLEIVLAVCQEYDVRPGLSGKRTTALLALTDSHHGNLTGRSSK
ncbi:ATP-binding protein [Streptomyces sp. NPDC086783]|uniref:ATP-binding protein n=1 Tax=Streptomyces sp. NPDC086783 TaxID=3365758 RepID=UPI003800510E